MYYEYNPEYGWSLIPDKKILHNFGDVSLDMRFNSLGFNDIEWDKKKKPGTVRIAFLGDSIPAGIQVEKSKTFPAVVEKQLNQIFKGAPRIETMNFGVPGYSLDQEYLVYRNVIKTFKPDIVVLCVYTANDFYDTSNPYNKGAGSFKPYYVYGPHGSLVLKNAPVPRNLTTFPTGRGQGLRGITSGFLRKHVALYPFFVDKLMSQFPKQFKQPEDGVTFISGGVPDDVYLENPSKEWEKAISLYFRIAAALARDCQKDNTRLIPVTIPVREQVSDDLWKQTSDRARKQGKKYSRDGIEIRTINEFDALGVQGFPLLDPMKKTVEKQGRDINEVYFKKNMHLTATGHEIAGGLIADYLKDIIRTPR